MKILIAVLLAVLSTSVLAEWTRVSGNDTHTSYADLSTIRKSGNAVWMWDLLDHKVVMTVGNTRYLSVTSQHEYDCKEETSRMLTFNEYSKNMGQGEVVYMSGNTHAELVPMSPDSLLKTLFKVACGK
jgi:hypothetical protein